MLCIDPVISGPCVVVPAVSKFVQIPMKHGLLCIAWQFSVESLPKGDRSLIRRRQEILEQIWELTSELGVLTGADPSVWQLSILPPITTGKIQLPQILTGKEVCPRPASPDPFYFCSPGCDLSPKVRGSHFPAPEISEQLLFLMKDFHPNMVEVAQHVWQNHDIVKMWMRHLSWISNLAWEMWKVLLQFSRLVSLSGVCVFFFSPSQPYINWLCKIPHITLAMRTFISLF